MGAVVPSGNDWPFWVFQQNFIELQQRMRQVAETAPEQDGYIKPEAICQEPMFAKAPVFDKAHTDQVHQWRKQFETYIASKQLTIAPFTDADTEAVIAFLHRRYPQHVAQETSAFNLFMYREYGHGAILKEPGSGRVVGTVFEMSMNTADKTSFTHRLAIDANYEGKNLGYHLMMYSCLLSMEKVSMIKRGIIQIGNLRSLHINLNKVGWVADGFEHISTLGDFVRIAIPLNLRGLTSNVIDQDKLMHFIHTHQEGKDYQMVPALDTEAIRSLFQLPERYKIVSLLKANTYQPDPMLLAVPNAVMLT